MSGVWLGLDLDEVTARWQRGLAPYASAATGIPVDQLPPLADWSLVRSGWFHSEEQFRQVHDEAVRDGLYRQLEPMPGAREQLWRLSDAGVNIRVITHRLGTNGAHGFAAGDTVRWLDDNEIPYRDLCFVADKSMVNADIYIDDAPHNLMRLRGSGRYAIAFDQPYNAHLEGPRAVNWEQAAALILDRKALIDAGQVPRAA